MDSLLRFYPAIVSLCDKLSFQELMSLSLVSKEWLDATDLFVVKRALFVFLKEHGIAFPRRKYKFVKISEVDLELVIDTVPDSAEDIELETSRISNFTQFLKFKKLKSLTVDGFSLPQEAPTVTELALSLKSLKIIGTEDGLSLFKELIGANSSIESLSLDGGCTFYEEFEDFIRNINLPNLMSVSITNLDHYFKDMLIDFFCKHKNIRCCSLDKSEINAEVVRALGKNCKNLERLSLRSCYFLEEREVTSNELNLMSKLKHLDLSYTSFTAEALEKLHSRQLQTFKMAHIQVNPTQARSILKTMKYIKVLDISQWGKNLDSSILPYIAGIMPNLVDLTIQELVLLPGCNDALNDVNKRSCSKFDKLEKLKMSYIISADELIRLISAPKLRVFTSHHCDIGREGLRNIVNWGLLLEELTLKGYKMDELDMAYIATNSRSLRRLECKIDEPGLKILLTKTWIEECRLSTKVIDFDEIAHLKEGFQALDFSEHIDFLKLGRPSEQVITNGARTLFCN